MGMLLRLFALFIAFTLSNCDGDKEYCNFGRESYTLFQTQPNKVLNINYDGLHDALLVHDNVNGLVIKYVSTTGDFPQYSVTLQHSGFCVGGEVFTADITGDKKDEIICKSASNAFSAKINYNGKWDTDVHIASGFTCGTPAKVFFGNFDGAGGEDILCLDPINDATPIKMFFFRSCSPSYSSAQIQGDARYHDSLYHHPNGYAHSGQMNNHHHLPGHLDTYHGNDHSHYYEQRYGRYKRHTGYTLYSYYGRDNTNSACGTGTDRDNIDATTFMADCTGGPNRKIVIMDYNNDKIDDIVCVSTGDTAISDDGIVKIASTGLFATGNVFQPGVTDANVLCESGTNGDNIQWILQETDIDGDGDQDLTCVRPGANSLQAFVFYNDGSGGFANNHKIPDSGSPNCLDFCNWSATTTTVTVGDYNHDGNDDLMCRNTAGDDPADIRLDIIYSSIMLTI